jgi:AT-hook transcription factor
VGKALRCRACKRKAMAAAAQRSRQRDPERHRRQWKATEARRRADPVRHAHDLAVKKAWRERNVVRIKLGKRKWRLNPERPNGYSSREKYEAYHRAYRAKHAEHRRQLARARYARLHPHRPHPVCACGCAQPIPWDGRGRPRKWLPEHDPWPRPLTRKEVLVKASERAIEILEKAATRVRDKLAGVKELQDELAAIEAALVALRQVPTTAVPIRRRGRPPKAQAA